MYKNKLLSTQCSHLCVIRWPFIPFIPLNHEGTSCLFSSSRSTKSLHTELLSSLMNAVASPGLPTRPVRPILCEWVKSIEWIGGKLWEEVSGERYTMSYMLGTVLHWISHIYTLATISTTHETLSCSHVHEALPGAAKSSQVSHPLLYPHLRVLYSLVPPHARCWCVTFELIKLGRGRVWALK